MNLTTQQQQLLVQGKPVEVDVAGEKCVLLTRRAFERVALAAEGGAAGVEAKSGRLSDLIGAWRTASMVTDDDIQRILEEERIRKHA